jgi:hypothetical protein
MKLKGFGYMKKYNPDLFHKLQSERGKKGGSANLGKGISLEEMLNRLQIFSKKIGHVPSIAEVDSACRNDVCCSAHYQQKFGSFNSAMERAGLIPNKQCNNSNIIFDLETVEEQVLLGSLLGDGCITKNRYRENHSIAQRDYLLWKVHLLKRFCPKVRFYKLNGKRMVGIDTMSLPILQKMMFEFYTPNKQVTRNILDKLNALGLAIWYMDDGCIHKHGYIRWATHSFGLKGNRIIKAWLYSKYNVIATIYHTKQAVDSKKGYYIYLPKRESVKLLNIMLPFAHKDMFYKFRFEKLAHPNH